MVCALTFCGLAFGESQPVWELEILDSEKALFEAAKLHPKAEGWLLTCRMRVKSLSLIAPISKLELWGLDGAKEKAWEKSVTIRRKDFDAAYGGGRSQFLRILIKDLPDEVERVQLRYEVDEKVEES